MWFVRCDAMRRGGGGGYGAARCGAEEGWGRRERRGRANLVVSLFVCLSFRIRFPDVGLMLLNSETEKRRSHPCAHPMHERS